MTAIPALLYSDEAESLVYLVNAEIIVRRPALIAAQDHWGEPAGTVEPEPALIAARDDWGESLSEVIEPEPALAAAYDHSTATAGETAFSFPVRRETRHATTWSARALPDWAGVEPASSPGGLHKTLSAKRTLSVRTWTAHGPPPPAT